MATRRSGGRPSDVSMETICQELLNLQSSSDKHFIPFYLPDTSIDNLGFRAVAKSDIGNLSAWRHLFGVRTDSLKVQMDDIVPFGNLVCRVK